MGFDGTLEIISGIAMRKKKLWKILAFIVKFDFLCCMSNFFIHICHAPWTIRFHPIDAYDFFYCVQLVAMPSSNLRPNIGEWKKKGSCGAALRAARQI